MDKVRKAAATYFALQAIAVAGWWLMLVTSPGSREWFRLERNSLISLWGFWLPDLVIVGPLSFATSWLIIRRARYAEAAAWLVTGAVSYATLHTTAIVFMTDLGWPGVVLMMPAMLWSGVFALGLTVGRGMFRQAKPSTANHVLTKTLVQIAVVWSVVLILIPYGIALVESKLGVQAIRFGIQQPLAIVLFVGASSLGVWAAVVMSRIGKGTPLPLDHASDLVVAGPYGYLRNPMAVSGIGQGLCVAMFLGSPLVAVYAFTGSAIWQLVFRPLEEDDLDERFGGAYRHYRDSVRCWLPRWKPYQIDGASASSNSLTVPSGRM